MESLPKREPVEAVDWHFGERLPHHPELEGRPLESIESVINLIGSTTTSTGLRIRMWRDTAR
jgi:hypothetical protein